MTRRRLVQVSTWKIVQPSLRWLRGPPWSDLGIRCPIFSVQLKLSHHIPIVRRLLSIGLFIHVWNRSYTHVWTFRVLLLLPRRCNWYVRRLNSILWAISSFCSQQSDFVNFRLNEKARWWNSIHYWRILKLKFQKKHKWI